MRIEFLTLRWRVGLMAQNGQHNALSDGNVQCHIFRLKMKDIQQSN